MNLNKPVFLASSSDEASSQKKILEDKFGKNDFNKADVIVTDGFSGNIALKTAEGTANLIKKFFLDEFSSSISGIFMGLLMKRKLRRLKERMDPRTLNGGVFVGLNGLVIKSHGSSDSKSFYSALKLAKNMCKTKST